MTVNDSRLLSTHVLTPVWSFIRLTVFKQAKYLAPFGKTGNAVDEFLVVRHPCVGLRYGLVNAGLTFRIIIGVLDLGGNAKLETNTYP